MNIPADLKYSSEHEWVRAEGDEASIGITDHAQQALGDIVFVELPEVGDEVGAGEAFAVVESVKAASDVYAPVSGKIIKVNERLFASPELVNSDPYGSWFVVVLMSDPGELATLLSAEDYNKFCEEE
ncbi:glycine cleavage system protein GcvH [Pelotomaculum terephthalicicum JT]|uniref:glycine cleavage system protein GcvH n=1 Tax=Pelotomaculum TaxID=191373 RepID=UPI0009CE5DAB|nr:MULTISPECIES: glycine cleavage system protein GcvH [Pelotomaculum]MCG9967171.1 glycine cleavage system protein GcvH [Pelotomaculum terephthalicicum JT]OPX90636.1 MAG: Glycine cleavage system H protein [Pelotomaculum sp. PtaB.Bin117]OPY62084.1 MAG: Glycine cleavage system H protein [Pelotomaculum sp. PtaU1.Bin065]